jgi:hypothetical protein
MSEEEFLARQRAFEKDGILGLCVGYVQQYRSASSQVAADQKTKHSGKESVVFELAGQAERPSRSAARSLSVLEGGPAVRIPFAPAGSRAKSETLCDLLSITVGFRAMRANHLRELLTQTRVRCWG